MVTNAAMVKLAKSEVEGCTDDITACGWSGYKPNGLLHILQAFFF